MRKLIALTVPIKTFAAMLFAGFICLYIFSGIMYATFINETFAYSISFLHLLKGIGFTMLVSLLWGLAFSDTVIKKWSFLKREILFIASLSLLSILFLVMFQVIETEWSTLWLTVAGTIVIFVIVLSQLSEWYFRKTSHHYTNLLKVYQRENQFD